MEFPFHVLFSSSEKSVFLSLPIPASLVTLWVPAPDLALFSPPEEEEEEEVVVVVVVDPDCGVGSRVPPAVPMKVEMIPQRIVKGVRRSQTRDMKSPLWEARVELGRTITVQDGAIWRSFRVAALSSVSRLRRGKLVEREKEV